MKLYILKMQVNISFLFWAVVTLMLIFDRTDTAIIAFISACLHEMGHLVLMFIFKSPPQKLTIGIFGMRIDKSESTLSYKKEALVALAGPTVNIIIFTVFYILNIFCNKELHLKISLINLLMGAFNLIPIEPLDGGRAIKNTLLAFDNKQCAEKLTDIFSFSVLFILFVMSIFLIKRSGYNFTLFIFCVYISFYIFFKKR